MISKRIEEAEALAREAGLYGAGRNPGARQFGVEVCAVTSGRTKSEDRSLMERVVERSNMRLAYQRVIENKGAPGVDGVTVAEFKDWLKVRWPSVKQALLAGQYLPRPVRRVDIPKPSGGVRTLGVPTVVDRLIQQALHQVLQPLFEPEFSTHSYGFRPGRRAQQAVQAAQASIREGKRWVVDLDLEQFFDRVAGEGTPQCGPLSPLLSNILLTDLDRELERRGLRFCRYADDCNIYVGSYVAGERVMRGVRAFLEEALHLRVNVAKSAVARPWERKFLGYTFTAHRQSRLRIAPESVRRLVERVRERLRGGRGRSLRWVIEDLNPLLRGWIHYFQLTESRRVLERIDGWLRRRLRGLLWRQWKRASTRARQMRALGLSAERARRSAGNGRGPWWNAGASHLNQALPALYFARMGLVSLLGEQQRLQCVR